MKRKSITSSETFANILLTIAICLVIVVIIVGCRGGICPPPDVVVERIESSEQTGVTVYFKNFPGDNTGTRYIRLRSPEEITAFRDKLEFVIRRLEESENSMNIHEQRGNNEVDASKGTSTLSTDGVATPQT